MSYLPGTTGDIGATRPPTDKEMLDSINGAATALEKAINVAIAAGLEVSFSIDASDIVDVTWNKAEVRMIPATAIRRIK